MWARPGQHVGRKEEKKVHYNLKNRPTLLADKLKHPQNRAGGKGVVGNFFNSSHVFVRNQQQALLVCVCPPVRWFFSHRAPFLLCSCDVWDDISRGMVRTKGSCSRPVLTLSIMTWARPSSFPGSVHRIMARPSSFWGVTGASNDPVGGADGGQI